MWPFKSKEEKIREYNERLQRETERINSLGVFPTKTLQLRYSAFPIIHIDDNNKKILVINSPGNEHVLDYKDIIDFELVVDDVSTFRYGLKTALTGKLDSKKKINNIQVNLYVNNIDCSFVEIRIFPQYGTAVTWYEGEELANQLIGVLHYIKNNSK